MAALGTESVTFTGDAQIAKRSAGPLLEALANFGVEYQARDGGFTPITVKGPWKGGRASVACNTSQYLSALLLAAPLAPKGVMTEIQVPLLNEKPYIEMTLSYLSRAGIKCEFTDFSYFKLPGGFHWEPLMGNVPADFSSAAFPACAAAVSGGLVVLEGLDPEDSQGDKKFFDILQKMGATVEWKKIEPTLDNEAATWEVRVTGTALCGGTFDLNDTPDLFPAVAVLGAFAKGETRIVNVAHARIKETDRIACMTAELRKMGADVHELADGILVHGSSLHGADLDGSGDHRLVMALSCAALAASTPSTISTSETADVTYPNFFEMLSIY
jgi:3-phosphoshikimate 1-carboxyvinyltransferase